MKRTASKKPVAKKSSAKRRAPNRSAQPRRVASKPPAKVAEPVLPRGGARVEEWLSLVQEAIAAEDANAVNVLAKRISNWMLIIDAEGDDAPLRAALKKLDKRIVAVSKRRELVDALRGLESSIYAT